jgi:hypothetical protein
MLLSHSVCIKPVNKPVKSTGRMLGWYDANRCRNGQRNSNCRKKNVGVEPTGTHTGADQKHSSPEGHLFATTSPLCHPKQKLQCDKDGDEDSPVRLRHRLVTQGRPERELRDKAKNHNAQQDVDSRKH